MELQLDHIVHFIKGSPKKAIDEWEKIGYQAVIGGSHEKWGTFNSLLYNSTSYIEFLAVEDEGIAQNSDNPLISQLVSDLHKGEGIGQICFRTNDILTVKNELEKKGCKTFPIFPGSRKRQDGSTIKWKMLFIKQESTLPSPFFIEWEQQDEDRYNELKKLGMVDQKLAKHQIQSINFACNNGEESAKEWSQLFDFPISHTEKDRESSLIKTTINCGTTKIIFCEPLDANGIVYDTLKLRGERPFLVQLEPELLTQPIFLFGSCYQ
ncbi:VOC family protein [Bacillus sp. DTU_2020_1000418_1_SI_GHA_SEK_038]|uniref:VOC family protein n=1 Tax=Bacillus sp. DTU_2020_1000418_1_SI_GHA_SEK_038 TaxID=3077585 RepID=UPI0028E20677|nr:VOC family protein [Bacillus sp. DTU_2020_1000418_1_SI_GHA_SEK_038]WNS73521.1 VOC family protein [Bacillus sp. DTU_2020_1000418_1_SI_GHA_SEK_038]